MMKKICMVALDFDLTLVDYPPDGSYQVAPEAVGAFASMIKAGGWVGLVSGRDVWPMRDILSVAGIRWGEPFPNYFIRRENYLYALDNGAWTADAEWNRSIMDRTKRFCMEHAGEVPDWLRMLEGEGFAAKNWNLFADFGLEIHFETEKMAAGAMETLQDVLRNREEITLHRNRMMLNMVPAGTGKGAALAHAAERFGLEASQALAFGDSQNDLSMLDGRHGFLSGTVSNADEQVKRRVLANGGYVASERASRGVYEVLLRYAQDGRIDALR